MNFRCAVALLVFLPVGAGHCADAYVETRIQHYAISGQSADELRTAIIEASDRWGEVATAPLLRLSSLRRSLVTRRWGKLFAR